MNPNAEAPSSWCLEPGQSIEGDRGPLILHSGAMQLELLSEGEAPTTIGVAFAGDVLFANAADDQRSTTRLRALTPCDMRPMTPEAARPATEQFATLLWQTRRQGRDLLRMRTGQVTERIRYLLLKLSESGQVDLALPRLRDMASLVDSTPETVSRVIGSLSRLDVLHGRQRQKASVDRSRLSHLKPVSGMTRSSPAGKAGLPAAA